MRDVRLPAPSKLSLKLINARTRNRVNKCTSSMVFTVMLSHSSRFITNINMPKRPTYCPMATASQLRVNILRAKWWSISRQIQQPTPSPRPHSTCTLTNNTQMDLYDKLGLIYCIWTPLYKCLYRPWLTLASHNTSTLIHKSVLLQS